MSKWETMSPGEREVANRRWLEEQKSEPQEKKEEDNE